MCSSDLYVRADDQPTTGADGVVSGAPLRTAVLSEAQVQDLLKFALGDGALGRAGPSYTANVADAPSTTFAIAVDGLRAAGDALVMSCINCHREYKLEVPKIWTERQLPPEEQKK